MICPSSWHQPPNVLLLISMTVICFLSHHVVDGYDSAPATLSHSAGGRIYGGSGGSGGHNLESRSSYAMLSEAMSHAVSHEFSHTAGSGSADGACSADDLECNNNLQDRLGMEAIRSLHRQLDDDDNGNIDLEESDDFLREELKYEAGYEKRHKTFHYNDDSQISVKELWEAWLRSEVHNWTVEQTTDWLSQSVQLPQYVDIFKNHKVSGAALPRLAVNNMHFVSNVLGIKDPIHKQKIALKAMDVVLFGPPRETGTRWKDYILVTLLLSAIIGGWYAYQQNKNAKRHLRRMAQDMEGLQKAENALTEMQKELERARMEQENVATEKLDLERRLKEAPLLTSNSSDMELQQLKQEIEMLRTELSRAEVELVDHCWSPPPGLQTWLQLTYELESKNHLKKRVLAEKQLQSAREACEKLRRKRSSLVGAFVSTHGKSIDDVDRSIVEARNALSDVTYELQERLHRWKQVETLLGLSIVNNNGLSYLENVLYTRNGSGKFTRARITSSQDDLDDESVQGIFDSSNHGRCRDDSSASDDGDNMSVTFSVGGSIPILPTSFINSNTVAPSGGGGNPIMTTTNTLGTVPPSQLQQLQQQQQQTQPPQLQSSVSLPYPSSSSIVTSVPSSAATPPILQLSNFNHHPLNSSESVVHSQLDDTRQSSSSSMVSQEKVVVPMPRAKKMPIPQPVSTRAPMPPPRRANSHQSFSTNNHIIRSHSADLVAMESTSSAVVSAAPHGDTQLDDNSTDSSSLDDETKKRRRKLRFPFGKKTIKDKNA